MGLVVFSRRRASYGLDGRRVDQVRLIVREALIGHEPFELPAGIAIAPGDALGNASSPLVGLALKLGDAFEPFVRRHGLRSAVFGLDAGRAHDGSCVAGLRPHKSFAPRTVACAIPPLPRFFIWNRTSSPRDVRHIGDVRRDAHRPMGF